MSIEKLALGAVVLSLALGAPALADPVISDSFGNDDLESTSAPDVGKGFSATGTQNTASVIEGSGLATLTSDGGWNIATMRSNDLFPWFDFSGAKITWDIASSQVGDVDSRQWLGVLGAEFPDSAPNPENTSNAPAAYVKLRTNDGNGFQGAIVTTTSDGGPSTLDTWDWAWDGLSPVSVSLTMFAGGWSMSSSDGISRSGNWDAVNGLWDDSVWGAGAMAAVQAQGAGVEFITEIDAITVEPASVITVLGDFNADNVVNVLDYDLLANNFLVGSVYAQGDINFDGSVNLFDYKEFKALYPAAADTPVPEPTSGVLLICGGLVWVVGRRRWRV